MKLKCILLLAFILKSKISKSLFYVVLLIYCNIFLHLPMTKITVLEIVITFSEKLSLRKYPKTNCSNALALNTDTQITNPRLRLCFLFHTIISQLLLHNCSVCVYMCPQRKEPTPTKKYCLQYVELKMRLFERFTFLRACSLLWHLKKWGCSFWYVPSACQSIMCSYCLTTHFSLWF